MKAEGWAADPALGEAAGRIVEFHDGVGVGPAGDGAGGTFQVEGPDVAGEADPVADLQAGGGLVGGRAMVVTLTSGDRRLDGVEVSVESACGDQLDERLYLGCLDVAVPFGASLGGPWRAD